MHKHERACVYERESVWMYVCIFCITVSVYVLWQCWVQHGLAPLVQDFTGVDPHFLKVFRLSQLIIEYLLVSDHPTSSAWCSTTVEDSSVCV